LVQQAFDLKRLGDIGLELRVHKHVADLAAQQRPHVAFELWRDLLWLV